MRLAGITDLSTVDWYGETSMVVFFAGCNFRCPYCQNSGLIPLDSGEDVSIELVESRINQAQRPVETITAVVLTGGEPLLQPDSVLEIALKAKEYGLKVMLDTNGSILRSFKMVIETGLIDRVALDVKAPLDPSEYERVIAVPNSGGRVIESIRSVLEICKKSGVELEVRTTVAPELSDDLDFIRDIAISIDGFYDVFYLQQFDNQGEVLSPELKGRLPPTRHRMLELANVAVNEGLERVYIKTRAEGLERIR